MSREAPTLSEQYGPGADADDVFCTIEEEAKRNSMSDMDIWYAWRLGLAAYQQMRELERQGGGGQDAYEDDMVREMFDGDADYIFHAGLTDIGDK